MSLTREEADQIVKEAIFQGWAEEANREQARDLGEGSVDLIDFGTPPGVPGPGGNHGCIVDLVFPGMYSDTRYWIGSTEEWRQLKAKVDELREILHQAGGRGWEVTGRPQKVGKYGMMVEIVPPGGSRVYPVRVGGMRTWRKLCREYDNVLDVGQPVITSGENTSSSEG